MIEDIQYLVSDLGQTVLKVLPDSPFTEVIEKFDIISSEALAFLNWFFPVGDVLKILSVWGVAVGGYYAYSAVMRHIKLVS